MVPKTVGYVKNYQNRFFELCGCECVLRIRIFCKSVFFVNVSKTEIRANRCLCVKIIKRVFYYFLCCFFLAPSKSSRKN